MRNKECGASLVKYSFLVVLLVVIAVPAVRFLGVAIEFKLLETESVIAGGQAISTMPPSGGGNFNVVKD